MSGQFKVHFSRYDSKRGDTRISGPQWVDAADFRGAVKIAEATLSGLQGGDPDREFHIHSIDDWGRQRATECGGGHMFETMEEFSERVNTKTAPKS